MADDIPPPAPPLVVPPVGDPPPAAPPVAPLVAAASPVPAPDNVPQSVFDRIDRLTKDKKLAEERAVAAEARLAAAPPPPPVGAPPAPPPAPILPIADIESAAQRIVAEREFTRQCNAIADAGRTAHADFPMKAQQLSVLGVLTPDFIGAAQAVGDPHELIYALAGDLNEASRIAGLAPEQKGIELMRFNEKRKAAAAKLISGAPPPPDTQVGGGNPPTTSEPLPTDSSDDWFAKREKQIGIKSGQYS